ncbi:MAG: hypothetical protein FWC40_10170 [Proteobacteria bacterium]|nr:hypothetical protein [Pseudomonadota bacterium]
MSKHNSLGTLADGEHAWRMLLAAHFMDSVRICAISWSCALNDGCMPEGALILFSQRFSIRSLSTS